MSDSPRLARSRSRSPRRDRGSFSQQQDPEIAAGTDAMLAELFDDNENKEQGEVAERRNSANGSVTGAVEQQEEEKKEDEWAILRVIEYAMQKWNVHSEEILMDEKNEPYLQVWDPDNQDRSIAIGPEASHLWEEERRLALNVPLPHVGEDPLAGGAAAGGNETGESADPATSSAAPAPIDPSIKRNLAELSDAEKNVMRRKFNEIKTNDIPQFLLEFANNGRKQKLLFGVENQVRKQPLRKRFMCHRSVKDKEDRTEALPNCPEFMVQVFDAFFKAQPSCSKMKIEYDYKNKMSFVLDISPDAWQLYLETTGRWAHTQELIQDAILDDMKAQLDERIYDSDTGLVGWRKAQGLLRKFENMGVNLERFTKKRCDKCIAPYQKHSDPDVAKLAKKILKGYKAQYTAKGKTSSPVAAPSNGVAANGGGDVGMADEDLDDLF